ncbi:MAG: enoyl-CoA hydratase/isomerase family protein [Proteobacteria bacterium]|nr:enoyl-CoA hydratase/isomerase family protein [Pseudomonadota bacterium]MBU1583176.1 enoyl-CoA hydratase/isomerase family protein [Pseudomonadota bacterium]MBU2456080.1 enoyl-CoA hydratase/isomerase family protein [Pseudomonadota bacterium]MBU2628849.1 enoyl-CoA hydratase/isomerase family protein [Pseudomonadota bacterium]
MAVIEWKKENNVAIIEMCNGPNRMNQIFAERMNVCLDEILEDTDIQAMVLTSTDEKNFSQGIDVEWIGGKLYTKENQAVISFMYGMNTIFKRLLLFPVPVIAAINGHAFGNGAILSCACDFRFMRKDKGFFCFPEVDVSIPFLPGMIGFVRKAIPEYQFNQMILSGRRMTAVDLESANVIVKACDPEALMTDAVAYATSFGKKRGIFQELKKRMHKELVRIIDEEDPEYIDAVNLFVAD